MLKIIQGDVFEICVELNDIDLELVSKVVFASKDLCAKQEAEECNGNYRVRLEGRETLNLTPGFACYDLIVYLTDGERITVRHNDKIEVLKKTNGGNHK